MKTVLILFASLLSPAFAPAASPWNGHWKFDAVRSSPQSRASAAEDYAFNVQPDGRLRWEIPSLREVVTGTITGQPMAIHRPGAPPGMTLSVRAQGSYVLCYQVARHGKVLGEGRMTLIDDGRAWVDLVWPYAKPQAAQALIYVRADQP